MNEYLSPFLRQSAASGIRPVPPKPVVREFEFAWCETDELYESTIALVDPGADYSALPEGWGKIAATRGIERSVIDIELPDGEMRTCDCYTLRYKIPHVMDDWDSAEFLIMDDYLIGRNILRKFVVTLDGPGETLRMTNADETRSLISRILARLGMRKR